jgi:HlyD family secretion protein
MRWPRLRFTIARLMILVLIVGLSIWGVRVVKNRLNPSIAEQQAQANYQQARLIREVAEYAYKEYENGIYPQDLATYQGQVKLAESDRERAIDRLKWSTDMKEKGFVPQATNIADRLTKQQADFDLEQAKMQLEVLEKYTREKKKKTLMSDIEKARADELSKLKSWRSERAWRLWWGAWN